MIMGDAEMFLLNINEPETKKKMDFYLRIDHCFLEDEIRGGIDLKNVNHLKKMARVLIEERALIKRVSSSNEEQLSNENLYTVEINLANTSPININEQLAQEIPEPYTTNPPPQRPAEKISREIVMEEDQEDDEEDPDLIKKSSSIGQRGQNNQ